MICSDAFSELITRHDLTTSERAKQNFAEVIRLRQMSETIINEVTFDIKTKEHVFRAFNKVLNLNEQSSSRIQLTYKSYFFRLCRMYLL